MFEGGTTDFSQVYVRFWGDENSEYDDRLVLEVVDKIFDRVVSLRRELVANVPEILTVFSGIEILREIYLQCDRANGWTRPARIQDTILVNALVLARLSRHYADPNDD